MKSLLLALLLLCNISISQAASGDSVMNAPSTTSTPGMSYQAATASSGNVYSYTSVTQYQTATCPAGLTANGSSIYNSAQRQIINTYLGSQLVGTNTTAWTDIDTDCIGTQTQVIACPAGYTGTITQQQKIGTGVGGYVYGGWVTTANNCVKIPVPKPGYTVLFAKPIYAFDGYNDYGPYGAYAYRLTIGVYINNQNGQLVCGKIVGGVLSEGTTSYSPFAAGSVGCTEATDRSYISLNSAYECLASSPCGQGDNGPVNEYFQVALKSRSPDNCEVNIQVYTNDSLMGVHYTDYQYGSYSFYVCQ